MSKRFWVKHNFLAWARDIVGSLLWEEGTSHSWFHCFFHCFANNKPQSYPRHPPTMHQKFEKGREDRLVGLMKWSKILSYSSLFWQLICQKKYVSNERLCHNNILCCLISAYSSPEMETRFSEQEVIRCSTKAQTESWHQNSPLGEGKGLENSLPPLNRL